MSATIHLIGFMINSPINHTILSWADRDDRRVEGLGSIASWQDLARLYEKGGFDGVFFADIPATFDQYKGRTDESVRHGICWPNHDPMPLLGIMAGSTRHLGLATTMSITARHPYTAVRELSTLDHVTGGRIGWNIVTGHLRAEYRAGHSARGARHALRSRRRISGRLQGAVGRHRAWCCAGGSRHGLFADPARVRTVDMTGRCYSCHAVVPILPSAASTGRTIGRRRFAAICSTR